MRHRIARTTADPDLGALADAASVLASAMDARPEQALERAAEVYPSAVEIDNVLALWQIASGGTAAAVALGDAELGGRWSDRAMEACLRLRVAEGPVLFEQRANVAALSHDYPSAARLYAAARRLQARTGLTGWNAPVTADLVERTRAALGASDFEEQGQLGATLTLSEISG